MHEQGMLQLDPPLRMQTSLITSSSANREHDTYPDITLNYAYPFDIGPYCRFVPIVIKSPLMITPKFVAVALILICIVAFASWSKLRFVDPDDHIEQRWRINDYPGFERNNKE